MNVREDFIALLHCKWGLARTGLSTLVLQVLSNLTLKVEDCRGQGYDGAGSVADHNSLSADILRLNNNAIYNHCFSLGSI